MMVWHCVFIFCLHLFIIAYHSESGSLTLEWDQASYGLPRVFKVLTKLPSLEADSCPKRKFNLITPKIGGEVGV